MVQKAIYLSIIYLFISPVLIDYGLLPNAARWFIEILSLSFIPVILICLAVNKKFYAPTVYVVLILLTFFIVGIGFIYNQSSASALILGLRHHFTYLPFFLLPLVYNFTEKEIKKILWLLFAILLLQAPISFLQRFVWFPHAGSGDVVGGTVIGSGILSVILVSAISIFYALFLAKQVKPRTFFIASACLLFPTLINETKATFIMLPVALTMSTILFGEKNIVLKLKKFGTYFVFTIVFAALFLYTYDAIYGDRHAPVIEHLQKEKQGKGYIYYGENRAMDRIEAGHRIGRLDTVMLAAKNISQDLGNLFFGIGIGNAVKTKISFLKTESDDIQKYLPDMTTISNILWELGFLGLFIQLLFLIFIFKDALALKGQNNFISALCMGWCSVIGVRFITLFYLNVLHSNVLDITFWLLSGILISKSYQFMLEIQLSNKNHKSIQVLPNPSLISQLDTK